MSNQTLGRLFNIAYISCQALWVGTQPKNLLPQNWEGNKSVVEREIKSGKPLSSKSESKGFISPSTSIVTSAGNSLRAPRTWGAAEEPTWPIRLLLAPCTFHYTKNINISSLFLDIIQPFLFELTYIITWHTAGWYWRLKSKPPSSKTGHCPSFQSWVLYSRLDFLKFVMCSLCSWKQTNGETYIVAWQLWSWHMVPYNKIQVLISSRGQYSE
jgi:hypothetical protein